MSRGDESSKPFVEPVKLSRRPVEVDQESARIALEATRRILASGDDASLRGGLFDLERERLTRAIIVQAASEHEVPIKTKELQAALDHLTGVDEVFGEYDVLALPFSLSGRVIQDVIVQDDGSVQIVVALPDRPHAGKPQHQVWSLEPFSLKSIGSDPKLLLDYPAQTMRTLCLGENERDSIQEVSMSVRLGRETICVEQKDPHRRGLNIMTSKTRKDVTELANIWCQIFDLCATDKYIGVLFNMNVSGHSDSPGAVQGRVTVRVRGSGANPLSQDQDRFFRSGWSMGSEMRCHDRKRVIVVQMDQKDDRHRLVDRGLMIFSNVGHEFYPSVPTHAFNRTHVALGAVWSWRHTSRGIVLSRFPLP